MAGSANTSRHFNASDINVSTCAGFIWSRLANPFPMKQRRFEAN